MTQIFSNALLCNILEVMAKPNFESPVHNPTDILENDLRVYMAPGSEIWRQWLKQSDIPEYRKIAESMIIPADDSNYHAMTRNELLTQRTHMAFTSTDPLKLE